jgi:hypothetical protein
MFPAKELGGAVGTREGAITSDSSSGKLGSRCLCLAKAFPRDVSRAGDGILVKSLRNELLRQCALHAG